MGVDDDFGLWEREFREGLRQRELRETLRQREPREGLRGQDPREAFRGREPREPREVVGAENLSEPSSSRGMLVVAAMTTLGCTSLIVLGEAPLGVAGLILSSLILLLWRAGM